MNKYTKTRIKGQAKLINYLNKYCNNITLLDYYAGSEVNVRVKDRFGNVYKIKPHEFERGYRSYKYLGTMKLVRILPKGYHLKSSYTNAATKVTIKCPYNHIFKLSLEEIERKLKNGQIICTNCGRNKYLKHEIEKGKKSFLKFFNNKLYPLGWRMNSSYKKAFDKVSFICPRGHHIKKAPAVLKENPSCPFCSLQDSHDRLVRISIKGRQPRIRVAKRSFMEYYYKYLYPFGWRMLGKYTIGKAKVKFKTPMNNIVYMAPYALRIGSRPRLDKSKKWFLNYFNKHLEPLGYQIKSKYKGSHRLMKFRCGKGHFYTCTPHAVEEGQHCPLCSRRQSLAETKMIQIFRIIDSQIDSSFYWDYANTTLFKPLHLDFVISNGSQLIGIEIDGKQHLKPVSYFGGEKGFVTEQLRDIRKNVKCIKNHIPLIRIRYPSHDFTYLKRALKWLLPKLFYHQRISCGIHYFY